MLIRALIRLVVVALALLLIAKIVPGIHISGLYTAIIVAILWGLVTLILRPVLFVLTLPINLLTLGLFSFVLNALLFWLLSTFVSGFIVDGFLPALIGSILLSLVTSALHAIFKVHHP